MYCRHTCSGNPNWMCAAQRLDKITISSNCVRRKFCLEHHIKVLCHWMIPSINNIIFISTNFLQSSRRYSHYDVFKPCISEDFLTEWASWRLMRPKRIMHCKTIVWCTYNLCAYRGNLLLYAHKVRVHQILVPMCPLCGATVEVALLDIVLILSYNNSYCTHTIIGFIHLERKGEVLTASRQ